MIFAERVQEKIKNKKKNEQKENDFSEKIFNYTRILSARLKKADDTQKIIIQNALTILNQAEMRSQQGKIEQSRKLYKIAKQVSKY